MGQGVHVAGLAATVLVRVEPEPQPTWEFDLVANSDCGSLASCRGMLGLMISTSHLCPQTPFVFR